MFPTKTTAGQTAGTGGATAVGAVTGGATAVAAVTTVLATLIATVVVTVAVAGPAHADTPAPPPSSAESAREFTVMTPVSSAASRSDRRPVAGGVYDRHVGKTFITWGGARQDNYIQSYDHRTRSWSAPVKVGDGGGDSHNYPTIVQADDGHLLVFRGVHNTELRMARSPRPHSIEGQWTDEVIVEGKGATYPMPFKTASGAIFVFIRETVRDLDPTAPPDLRPMKYVRSTDNGRTWRNSQQLTGDKWVIAPTDRPDNFNEIYIGQIRYEPATFWRPERVNIVYTLAGGGPEGPLHDRYHHNMYFTYFTPNDLRFHAASGRDLGTRIDDAEQERYLKIVDTPLLPAPYSRSPDYISLVGEFAATLPFVVWMQLDATGVLHAHSAVWTLHGWRTTELGTRVRVRTMEPTGLLTWRVYAVPEIGPGLPPGPGILTYQLDVTGKWRAGPVIDIPKPIQRIEIIGNGRDPARILATGASSARDVAVADGDVYVAGFARR